MERDGGSSRAEPLTQNMFISIGALTIFRADGMIRPLGRNEVRDVFVHRRELEGGWNGKEFQKLEKALVCSHLSL